MSDNQIYQQARISRDRRFDGCFFIAVKTTKIFCRSICPAKLPLEKNVEYFQLAQQAMHHGYRPCLRCRPDSAPKSHAWQGVTTTVRRASQLLQTHRDLTIAAIAEKLGIGDRYFRQLFKAQIGLSPKQFQLFDQLLLAKHLLHESHLSVEEIAQACGFSAARRLQIQMKKNSGLSPSQIRKQKKPPQQDIHLTLAFRPPYDWPQVREFLTLRAIKGIESIDETSYSRSFTIDEEHGWFKADFDKKHSQFRLSIKLSTMLILPKVITNIERILDLNADPLAINQGLMKSGMPVEIINQGLRLPGIWSPFEAGCRAILGQQISVKAAINLVSTLCIQLGERWHHRLNFVAPQAVAESDLNFLNIPHSRRQTLRAFAHWYQQHPESKIEEWLNIKGIGPWTVAYVNLRGLSLPDIWLETDLVIKNQLKKYTINADQARPWRSYLTLLLWKLA